MSEEDRRFDCLVYLEKTMQDSVLEVIPFDLRSPVRAAGVLYISRIRTVQIEAPRTVRVFQNRMYLCENAPDILPKWAIFVNGVIDTPDLAPTAARDSFIRDAKLDQLRDLLGDRIIAHLEALHAEDPDRFSQILVYHNLGLKAACHYYDEFFKKFHHLIEWRTNSGRLIGGRSDPTPVRRTLPQILAALPHPPGEPQPLPCFTEPSSANQYFQMADAAGSLVVDASFWFESELIEKYARLQAGRVRLVRVDREDDPNVFRRLVEGTDDAVRRLAELMSRLILTVRGGRVRVEASRFSRRSCRRYFAPGSGRAPRRRRRTC